MKGRGSFTSATSQRLKKKSLGRQKSQTGGLKKKNLGNLENLENIKMPKILELRKIEMEGF